MKQQENRRSVFKKIGLSLAGILGYGVAKAASNSIPMEVAPQKEVFDVVTDQDGVPLFSGGVKYGNLLFVAGKGAHFDGDIKSHVDHVLKELEKELVKHGSSMEKVLKVNVYLADLADYNGLNEVYRGRFGKNPPVRTTVATYGGVPGNSLVEMDCIAAI